MNITSILRRLLCLVMALLLVNSTAVPALAEHYIVNDADQLVASFNNVLSGYEPTNTFSLNQSIDMSGHTLTVYDTFTYIIEGNHNTLSNVDIVTYGNDSGVKDAKVNIYADITDNGNQNSFAALYVSGSADVTVHGRVTVTADGGSQTHAVVAQNGADITLNHAVTSKDSGIVATQDSEIYLQSNLTLNGTNVNSDDPDLAISASDGSYVKVIGDVSSSKDGIDVLNNSEVIIMNDTTVANGDVYVSDSSLKVYGELTLQDGGIDVTDNSTMDAKDGTSVTSDVVITGGSTVNLHNGLSIQPTSDESARLIVEGSTLAVYGPTETPRIDVNNNSHAGFDAVEADFIAIGTGGSNDASRFLVSGHVSGMDSTTKLNTNGKSYSQLQGNVHGSITARGNSEVVVYGSVDHIPLVYDNARVTTNYAYSSLTNTHTSNAASQYDNNIVKLCKEYYTNSSMEMHMNTLRDIMSAVSVDLTKQMNLGNALVISLFQGDDIAMDLIPNFDYDTVADMGYNAASVRNLQNADSVNGYAVEMYKAAIAGAIKSVEAEPYTLIVTDSATNAKDYAKEIYSLINYSTTSLPRDAQNFLAQALSNNILSEAEAREFLIRFGGYTAGQKGIGAAIQKLIAAYDMTSALGALNSGTKVIMNAAQFKDFFAQNYTNQVAVLDNMLMNQEMSPEMFVAVAQLRSEYDDKVLGALGIGQKIAKDELADAVKDCISKRLPLYGIVDSVMGLAEVLGATKKSDAVHKAAPIICYLPLAMDAYEDAILRVKNGDTSDEAIQMVEMNYTFVRESLKTLCKYMTVAGNSTQKAEYQSLLQDLQKLKIGHAISKEPTTMLTSGEFDLFYKNSIDPNVQYRYA